jgi:hypothetical protein
MRTAIPSSNQGRNASLDAGSGRWGGWSAIRKLAYGAVALETRGVFRKFLKGSQLRLKGDLFLKPCLEGLRRPRASGRGIAIGQRQPKYSPDECHRTEGPSLVLG